MTKKHSCLFIFWILFPLIVSAQNPLFQWAVSAGGTSLDETLAYAVTHDDLGNVYATGHFEGSVDFDPGPGVFNLTSSGAQDFFLTKLDASGNFVWAKKAGGTFGESGRSLTIDKTGNIFVTGIFSSTADFNPGLGVYTITPVGSSDIFILKLDAAGNFVWVKQFGGANQDYGSSIKLDTSGNIYTTGYFTNVVDFNPGSATYTLTTGAGTYDAFVSKLDATGNFIWAKQLGGSGNDFGRSLDVDVSGNVYSSGYFQGSADFDPGSSVANLIASGLNDAYVSKLDANGNFVWANQIGGSNDDYSYALVVDTLANVYVSGWFYGNADFDPGPSTYTLNSFGNNDVFITKLNSSGGFVWAKQLGGTSYDNCYGLAVDQYSNIYSIGRFLGTSDFDPGIGTYSLTAVGNNDVFISKLNPDGDFEWVSQIGGTSYEYGESVSVSESGNVYATGYFGGSVDFDPSANSYTLSTVPSSSTLNDMFILKMRNCETSATISPTVCSSYVSPSGNYTWTANGTYHDIVPNSIGCDSIITINLSIKQTTSSITPVACNSYTSPSGNYIWTSSGTYLDTLSNAVGCDSIITIVLTIKYSTSSAITPVVCNSYLSPSNNFTLTSSGIYTDVVLNSVGCDSVITINLTIKNSTSSTITPIACDTYTSPSGNYILTSSGFYTDTIANAVGCDSVIVINLSTINIDNTVTNSGTSLSANASGINYQWIDCDNGNVAIAGEINQVFTPSVSGNYAVLLSSGVCSKQSACNNILINSLIDNLISEKEYAVYPNPTNEFLYIETNNSNEQVLELSNTLGQIVFKTKFVNYFVINMHNFPSSIYYLRVNNRGCYKIVKE